MAKKTGKETIMEWANSLPDDVVVIKVAQSVETVEIPSDDGEWKKFERSGEEFTAWRYTSELLKKPRARLDINEMG